MTGVQSYLNSKRSKQQKMTLLLLGFSYFLFEYRANHIAPYCDNTENPTSHLTLSSIPSHKVYCTNYLPLTFRRLIPPVGALYDAFCALGTLEMNGYSSKQKQELHYASDCEH